MTFAPPPTLATILPSPVRQRNRAGRSFRVCARTQIFVRARFQPCRKRRCIHTASAAEVPALLLSHGLFRCDINAAYSARALAPEAPSRPSPANCTIRVGHRFRDDIELRASQRQRSRCSIRAKSSPFSSTNYRLRLTNHVSKFRGPGCAPRTGVVRGGTVNRPRAHVTHRKQTAGHMQGRNFPVHFLFLFSARFLIVVRAFLRGVPETLRVLARLPGTVVRVETPRLFT